MMIFLFQLSVLLSYSTQVLFPDHTITLHSSMTLQRFFVLLCMDPGLGRLDYHSLSHQTLMEMVIDGITNKSKICGSSDPSRDIAEWPRVRVDTDGHVTKISVYNSNLTGSFALEWLPSTVEYVYLTRNNLSGSVNLAQLPDTLKVLNMSINHLDGTLCFAHLPDALEGLYMADNAFTGVVDLTKLPRKMMGIGLGKNRLSGTLGLTKLPEGLLLISLENNDFVGETDFSQLPEKLKNFDVSHNRELSGEILDRDGMNIVLNETRVKLVYP